MKRGVLIPGFMKMINDADYPELEKLCAALLTDCTAADIDEKLFETVTIEELRATMERIRQRLIGQRASGVSPEDSAGKMPAARPRRTLPDLFRELGGEFCAAADALERTGDKIRRDLEPIRKLWQEKTQQPQQTAKPKL